MKNATAYGKKLSRLLNDLNKRHTPPAPPEDLDPLEVLAVAVLREGASQREALKALELLRTEFVDFNEVRVAPVKDISDLLDSTLPGARAKGEKITLVLNRVYDHGNTLDLCQTADMGKRELREHLREALALGSFGEAYVMTRLFETPSIPVSERLLEKLKIEEKVGPDATAENVRTLLERLVSAAGRPAAFELLTLYAAEPAKPPKKPAKAKKAAKSAKAKKAAKATKAKKAKQVKKVAKTKKVTKGTKTKKAVKGDKTAKAKSVKSVKSVKKAKKVTKAPKAKKTARPKRGGKTKK